MTLSEQYNAFRTILIKEILRFARIWVQTILPPAITTILYFVIFGNLIGSQIDDISGFSYIDYIVPGLILMTIISNSYANVVSSCYGAKFQHHIEEMIVSPMPNYVILLGFIAGGIARGVCVGLVVTGIAMIFADVHIHDYTVIALVLVLTSFLFSIAGFINAIFANSFDDISIIPTFILTPLTYLGGVFYSISMLPEFWQTVSFANPILYMVNLFRYGFLGISDVDLIQGFAIVIVFCVALFSWAMYLLNKGIGIRK